MQPVQNIAKMLQELKEEYLERLEQIAQEIQGSDELAIYLDTEEEEDYNRLKEMYEPKISIIHEEVAEKYPLQLTHLERLVMHEAFEGLFLPRILGYAVLRGEVNERYKYILPQEHFTDAVRTICQSSNFDILKQRIGQSIQIGFALSSDIWITNLINEVENKRIRSYLNGHKLPKYRIDQERRIGLVRYQRQFRNDNFQTAEFPETVSELKVMFSSLKNFLIYRINKSYDNASLVEPLMDFVQNEAFIGSDEHLQIIVLFAQFFDLEADNADKVKSILAKIRAEKPSFQQKYFKFILELQHHPDILIDAQADIRMASMLEKQEDNLLSEYYELMEAIHSKGYLNDEVQEAVRIFDSEYPGTSLEVEAVRRTIFAYFSRFITNLETTDYPEYMEITKAFAIYMQIFANQQFNQDLKELSMKYVKKLLKQYTDKRGKDYQDIKKFVAATFVDFNFLKEKEVKELFKTRKKRKPKVA